MILFNPSKLNFCPLHPKDYFNEGTYIEIRNFWGKLIYRLEKKDSHLSFRSGRDVTPNPHISFNGQFDYLKIIRSPSDLIGSFRVEIFCSQCGDASYLLSPKLPSLLIIDTDFYVTKD